MIEEAIQLLRTGSKGALLYYYLGTLPFVLGFIYFWAAMSRSPLAESQCTGMAAGLTLLFVLDPVLAISRTLSQLQRP